MSQLKGLALKKVICHREPLSMGEKEGSLKQCGMCKGP